MPGISFKKWFYDKARVKTFCKPVYARKFVKARELQFLGICLHVQFWAKVNSAYCTMSEFSSVTSLLDFFTTWTAFVILVINSVIKFEVYSCGSYSHLKYSYKYVPNSNNVIINY